ncbi:hypothetical protein ABH940_006975 [Streptacidiphilus sp. BW17]
MLLTVSELICHGVPTCPSSYDKLGRLADGRKSG